MSRGVGDALPEFRIGFVDPMAMKVWSEALRDPNPIHLDVEAVKAAGLGDRRINQGPANLAYIVNMLVAAFPGTPIASLDVRYMGTVLEGDAVVAGGTVTAIEDNGISCEVWLDAEGRGRVLAGNARVAVAG